MIKAIIITNYIAIICVASLFFIPNLSWADQDELLFISSETAEELTESEQSMMGRISTATPPEESTDISNDNNTTFPVRTAPLYYSTIDLEYAVGKTIGVDRNYGTLGFFTASCFCDRWLSFVDFKEHSIDDGKWGTSLGFGIRCKDSTNLRYWGCNCFYDYRSSSYKGFNQFGIGLESLGSCWDFRINGYLPIGTTGRYGPITVFNRYSGNFVVTSQPYIFALTGFDAEIGASVWQCDCFDVYFAAGPYYYSSAKDKFNGTWGGKCRLHFQCSDYLSCELKVSHDSIYNTCVQSIIRLEFPFDFFCCKIQSQCCNNPCQNNRCLGPVQRNDLIVLDCMRCWTKNY